jgi:hypothetical protein
MILLQEKNALRFVELIKNRSKTKHFLAPSGFCERNFKRLVHIAQPFYSWVFQKPLGSSLSLGSSRFANNICRFLVAEIKLQNNCWGISEQMVAVNYTDNKPSCEIVAELRNGGFHTLTDAEAKISIILQNGDIKTNDRCHRFFFYEIRPIFTVARYLAADTVIFGDRPDGVMRTNQNDVNVECTRDLNEKEGHKESLRLEILEKYHHVPAYQEINVIGTNNKKRELKNPEQVARRVDWEKITETKSRRFCQALERKNNLVGNDSDRYLIITFDDFEYRDSENYILASQMFWNFSKQNCKYSRVFIIGDSQKFLWDSHSPNICPKIED